MTVVRLSLVDLKASWNSAGLRIFGFKTHESVQMFIACLGKLDFEHLLVLRLL